MAANWERFNPVTVSTGLDQGLQAQIADPLWLLGRQWQMGEFTGDDAAQPAAARASWRTLPLESFRPGDGKVEKLSDERPVEELVEAIADTDLGGGGLYASARAGRRLLRLLRDEGPDGAVEALRAEYPARPTDHVVAMGNEAAGLLAWRSLDTPRIARARDASLRAKLGVKLDGAAVDAAMAVIAGWKAWYLARGGRLANPSWDDERLEYRFSLGARGPTGEVVVEAPEHWGGHLDWYTVDLATEPEASHGLKRARRDTQTTVVVPTPVRYPGMPASRWWEFEDGDVHFGDLDAGPGDLARLMVAEFATVYGDDWFVVPIPAPVGSLVEMTSLRVVDTFGGRAEIPATAFNDARRLGDSRRRSWRLFELTGDEVDADHAAPWLFVAPAVAGTLEGPALEQVQFARDEGANLAWAIEQLVEGPLGRGVDRPEAWRAAHPPAVDGEGASATDQAVYGDEWCRWVLESSGPPWWIPLVPERVDPASAEIRLRRARMQGWSQFTGRQLGPQSRILDPRRPRWLYEEEVPAGGARVERRWQYTRWHDGSIHVWLQHRKRAGRGGATSGLKADALEPHYSSEGVAPPR